MSRVLRTPIVYMQRLRRCFSIIWSGLYSIPFHHNSSLPGVYIGKFKSLIFCEKCGVLIQYTASAYMYIEFFPLNDIPKVDYFFNSYYS